MHGRDGPGGFVWAQARKIGHLLPLPLPLPVSVSGSVYGLFTKLF